MAARRLAPVFDRLIARGARGGHTTVRPADFSMFCDIPVDVARAIDLGACARYRGAPPEDARKLYGLEGSSKRRRFLFHCRAELVPILVRDIQAVAAKSQGRVFLEECASAIAALEQAVIDDAKPQPTGSPYNFGPNGM